MDSTNTIPGLTVRRYQGEQDLPAMLEVFKASGMEDHDHPQETLEDIASLYRHLRNCDPYQDVLIAEVEGRMAAYGRVNWWLTEPEDGVSSEGGSPKTAERIYAMVWYLRNEWRGGDLDRLFLRLCQERLRQIAWAQDCVEPFHGARFLEARATSDQPELARVLEEDGFQAVRWGSKMTCFVLQTLPEAPLPAGLEVRPAQPEHYRAIWMALWDAFHDDPGYRRPTEDDFAGWTQTSQFQPQLWQIAWAGGEVAGMVLNFIAPGPDGSPEAWTEDICVRHAWRRRGLARALLARSMRMFREMGFTQTSLGVDLNHPQNADAFYQSMGYRLVNVLTIYRKSF